MTLLIGCSQQNGTGTAVGTSHGTVADVEQGILILTDNPNTVKISGYPNPIHICRPENWIDESGTPILDTPCAKLDGYRHGDPSKRAWAQKYDQHLAELLTEWIAEKTPLIDIETNIDRTIGLDMDRN
jgi:hypothetical protein